MGIGKWNGLRAGTVGQVGAHRASEAVSWGEKQSAIAGADALRSGPMPPRITSKTRITSTPSKRASRPYPRSVTYSIQGKHACNKWSVFSIDLAPVRPQKQWNPRCVDGSAARLWPASRRVVENERVAIAAAMRAHPVHVAPVDACDPPPRLDHVDHSPARLLDTKLAAVKGSEGERVLVARVALVDVRAEQRGGGRLG